MKLIFLFLTIYLIYLFQEIECSKNQKGKETLKKYWNSVDAIEGKNHITTKLLDFLDSLDFLDFLI